MQTPASLTFFVQLEQTGTTIFQTLAGVALDIKTKKPAAESVSLSPHNGDDRDIQYLLNAFLIFNVVQLGAILALAHLHRKQKRATERMSAALLPPILEGEDDEDTADRTPLLKGPVDAWSRQDPTSPRICTKSAPATVRSLRGLASPSTSHHVPEQSIQLLRSASQSSSARSSRYLIPGVAPANGRLVRTKREVKRGEFFAILSGASIAFAWILFMGIAWLRLRSKAERAAHMGSFN